MTEPTPAADRPVPARNPPRSADGEQGSAPGVDLRFADTVSSAGASDTQASTPPLTVHQPPGGRYQIVAEIARGGMGVVLRAIDVDLQRPLAIKLMLESGDSEHQQRFLDEARITGQLQHPGIPPVHEVGRLADGRPFFAMKLIEGCTLADLLHQRASPRDDLPRYVKVFEQIAQTMAYAHSQGVIHRDLKPSNIMVGAFGEVQVMDWGLAKRLHAANPTDNGSGPAAAGDLSAPQPAIGGSASWPRVEAPDESLGEEATQLAQGTRGSTLGSHPVTLDGTVLGTPAFMPPEQAAGHIDALNERADVFGLGAILCVILIGRPPYIGTSRQEVIRRARQADLGEAQELLSSCHADAELAGLCRECLAAEAERRPADASQVAQRVSDYLHSVQERLRAAEIARAEALIKEEEERRVRRRNRVIGAGVVTIIAIVSGIVLWIQSQRATLNREITAALDDAEQRQRELHRRLVDEQECPRLLSDLDAWQAELQAIRDSWKRGDSLAAGGNRRLLSHDLRMRLDDCGAACDVDEREHRFAVELDTIRFEASSPVEGYVQMGRAGPKFAREFAAQGYDVEQEDAAALAERIRQSHTWRPVAAALDFWALATKDQSLREKLSQITRLVDPDPWRDRLRQSNAWFDLKHLMTLAKEVDFKRQSPQLLAALAQRIRLANGSPIPLLHQALVHHPDDFWLHFEVGHSNSNLVEQAGAFRAALAVRPRSAISYYGLGVMVLAERKTAEAAACFRRAVELDPNYAPSHNNLGLTLSDLGQQDEAIVCLQRAIELAPSAGAYTNLGSIWQQRGDFVRAEDFHRKALALNPNDIAAHNNLGTVLRMQGRLDEAIAAFRQTIELNPRHAYAHCNLGHVLRQQGKFREALVEFQLGHKYSATEKGWAFSSAEWIRETEEQIVLNAKMPAILQGEIKLASATENLRVAELCLTHHKKFAEAVRFYSAAFAGDGKLTAATHNHRYNAACAAALGAGDQPVAGPRTAAEQAAFREQCRNWLRADLTEWQQLLANGPDPALIAKTMAHWQADADLASIRDEAFLQQLMPGEKAAWRELWAEVAELRRRAEAAKPGR